MTMTGRMVFWVLCLALTGRGASVPFGPLMLARPALGDARLAPPPAEDAGREFAVGLARDTHAVTVTGWFRAVYREGWNLQVTTMSHYTPDAVRRFNPDLAAGAFGFGRPDGTNLTGTLAVDPFPWQPYEAGTEFAELWPRGVYTVGGWSSNEVTVSVGGESVTLGPGAFSRNVVPGGGAAVSVTGTGAAAVGISRTPAHEFFGGMNGVQQLGVGMELTPESTVSNVWRFCVWRIRLDEGAHVCRADFAPHWGAVFAGGEKAFAMPAAARRLSAAGVYRVGFAGLSPQFRVDVFDARFFHRWLSDDELARVHANGMEELARRGIPLWAERPAE